MFARQSGALNTGFVDSVLHCRAKNQQWDHYESIPILTITNHYRKNPTIMGVDKQIKFQPTQQKSPINHTGDEFIKVTPTFKVHNKTESSQIETLRGIAVQLIAHFDDQELEGLQFSNTTIPGSQLMTVPNDQKYMKKLQNLFHVGNFKIVQSYLDKDQLVLAIVRTADSILPGCTMHGLLNQSSITVNRVYENKFARPGRITEHNESSNCRQNFLETYETSKFIRHRRSSDYFTLYDEIEKVGALGDIATITRCNKIGSTKEECPISNLDGDSGYMSSPSGDSPGSPDTSEAPAISIGNGKISRTISIVPEIHQLSQTIFTLSALPTPLPIEDSVHTASFTGGFGSLDSSYRLPEKVFTVFRSPLPKPPLEIPPKTISPLRVPGNGSKLLISQRKGLSNRPPSACNVAPVVKHSLATRVSNRIKPNWSTPPIEFDITECHPIFKEPTTKSPKKPSKNYAKLRVQAAKINIAIKSIGNLTDINTAQTAYSAESPGDQQLNQPARIQAQTGVGPIPALSEGKYSPDSSLSRRLAPSKNLKTEVKVKKPLKNFKKARLLQSEIIHQDRRVCIDGATSSHTTQPIAGKMDNYPSVIASQLCPSSDPARVQACQSRCSSASSMFDEFPPGPIPINPGITKPLKNFQEIRTQAIDAKKNIPLSRPQLLNIDRTPTQMKQQCMDFSSLSAIGHPDLDVTPTQLYISESRVAFASAAHKSLAHDPTAFTTNRVSQTTISRPKSFIKPNTEAIGSANTGRPLITMHDLPSASLGKEANSLSLSLAGNNIVIPPISISPSAASKPYSPPNVGTVSAIRDTTPLQNRKLSISANPHRTGNFVTLMRIPHIPVSVSSPAMKVCKDSHKPQPTTQLSDAKGKNQSKVPDTIASKQNSRPTHLSGVYTTSKKLANPTPRSSSQFLSAFQGPVHFLPDHQYSARLNLVQSTPRDMSPCKGSHVARAPPKRSKGPTTTPVILNVPNNVSSPRGKADGSSAHRPSKASYLRNLTWS